jgi:hypothetical protein
MQLVEKKCRGSEICCADAVCWYVGPTRELGNLGFKLSFFVCVLINNKYAQMFLLTAFAIKNSTITCPNSMLYLYDRKNNWSTLKLSDAFIKVLTYYFFKSVVSLNSIVSKI